VLEDGKTRHDWSDAAVVDLAIRLGLLALLVYWALIILLPLLAMMIWSVIIAVALYPVFAWLAAALGGRRRLAAVVVTLICLLIVVGPVAWAALSLVESLQALVRHVEAGELAFPMPSASVKGWPLIGAQIYEFWELAATNFSAAVARAAPQLKSIGGSVLGIAATTGTGMLIFIASVAISGFLLVPGPSLVNALKAFARRIIASRSDEFVELAGLTVRNVSRGVIGIAVLQAGLAAVGMSVAQVPGTSILTFLALVLGIIQIGPGIIFIPVIVWSWVAMETPMALLFTVYMLPVCVVDNILRPIVMGRGLVTPMPVVFVGLIGGVLAHGMIGVFVGPIVLAIAWGLLVAWLANSGSAPATTAMENGER